MMPTGKPGRTHGTVGTYLWGCRCDLCADARRRYYGQRPMSEYLAAVVQTKHGTPTLYKKGCRCNDCRAAAAAARRDYRNRHPESRERENAKRLQRYYDEKASA